MIGGKKNDEMFRGMPTGLGIYRPRSLGSARVSVAASTKVTEGTVEFGVESTADSVTMRIEFTDGSIIETTVETFELDRAFMRQARGVPSSIPSLTTLQLPPLNESQ